MNQSQKSINISKGVLKLSYKCCTEYFKLRSVSLETSTVYSITTAQHKFKIS